jgi:hypothetical protein
LTSTANQLASDVLDHSTRPEMHDRVYDIAWHTYIYGRGVRVRKAMPVPRGDPDSREKRQFKVLS